MKINVCDRLRESVEYVYGNDAKSILAYMPSCTFEPAKVKAIMINEVVADTPENDFYSSAENPAYMETTIPLFKKAGAEISGIEDITRLGIYITNVVKLRNSELYYNDTRIFPAYIMTGKNILIEKSKVEMSAEDIAKMLKIIS